MNKLLPLSLFALSAFAQQPTFTTSTTAAPKPPSFVAVSPDDIVLINGKTYRVGDLEAVWTQQAKLREAAALVSATAGVDPPTTTVKRTVRMSVSHQPLATFIAVLGSTLSGVAGYSATFCLPSDAQAVSFSGLIGQQAIEARGLDVVSFQVAAQTAALARRQSKQYKLYSATSELAYGMTVAMPLLGVGSLAMQVAAPVIGHYAEKAKDNLNNQLPDAAVAFAGKFLDEGPVSLSPGGCTNKLFLGGYEKTMRAFAVDMVIQ